MFDVDKFEEMRNLKTEELDKLDKSNKALFESNHELTSANREVAAANIRFAETNNRFAQVEEEIHQLKFTSMALKFVTASSSAPIINIYFPGFKSKDGLKVNVTCFDFSPAVVENNS
jgi:hypothetical protein